MPGTAKKVPLYFITAKKLPPYFAVPGTAEIGTAKKLSIGNRQKNTNLKYYYTICVRREKTVPRKTLLYFEKIPLQPHSAPFTSTTIATTSTTNYFISFYHELLYIYLSNYLFITGVQSH